MSPSFELPKGDFRGHDRQFILHQTPDAELTEVGGLGKPCGEI
jgi:hypothetical protein